MLVETAEESTPTSNIELPVLKVTSALLPEAAEVKVVPVAICSASVDEL